MPTVSQPSSAPTLDPKPEQCFTCSSLEDHDRAWISKGPEKRHLVLCFDGTGDSFDQDVSHPSSPSTLGSRPQLNAVPVELQYRAIVGNVEEGRSHKAARLLSGEVPQHTRKIRHPNVISSGWYRYLHEQCSQDADSRGHIQTVGRNDCLRPPRPYQRFFRRSSSFTFSISRRLTNISRRVPVFDAKLLVYCALNPLSLPEAYRVRSDRAGDQICIFGLSRGAYTARALAGMVQRVGLLPHCNIEQLPFAYDLYVKDDLESRRVCTQFKQTFSINATIKFLGVWYVAQHIIDYPSHISAVQGHR